MNMSKIHCISWVSGLKVTFTLIALVLGIVNGASQVVIRDAPLSTADNSLLFVDGDVEYIGDIQILHKGIFEIKGGWYNSSVDDSVVFENEGNGWVVMSGGLQGFYGYFSTLFPSLRIAGTAKKVLNVDVKVKTILDLTDREFDVNGNTLYVMSAEKDAVWFSSGEGYVNTSNSNNGWLARYAMIDSAYIYPLASLNNTNEFRFRPLVLSPVENNGFVYSQFQHYNPVIDEYSPDKVDKPVLNINKNYYHSIKVDYDNIIQVDELTSHTVQDGEFNAVALWNESVGVWTAVLAESGKSLASYPTNNFQFFVPSINLHAGRKVEIDIANIHTVDSIVIHLPNIITPNNDGFNDKLVFGGLELYPQNELIVFNRWNNNVFERRGYSNDWDGSELNEGTYFYVLRVKDNNGTWHVFKNYLMLKR